MNREINITVSTKDQEKINKLIALVQADPNARLSIADLLRDSFITKAQSKELIRAIKDIHLKCISVKSILPKGAING